MPKRPTISHLQILKDVIRKYYAFQLTDEYYTILSRRENRSSQLEELFQEELHKYSTRYNKTDDR